MSNGTDKETAMSESAKKLVKALMAQGLSEEKATEVALAREYAVEFAEKYGTELSI